MRRAYTCLVLVALVACRAQRSPGPMPLQAPADIWETPTSGPLEALLVRHSDPVSLRRPGDLGSFPLAFYQKRERVTSGTWIHTAAGGRAELLWPGDASSLVLSGNGAAVVGEPTRGEPIAALVEVSYARLMLTPEDRVALPGGAVLRGDPVIPSGPFVVEQVDLGVVRLTNQSSRALEIRYRDTVLEVGPADSIDLPVVSTGTAPLAAEPTRALERAGITLVLSSEAQAREGDGGVVVRGTGTVRAQGVAVSLEADDEATFRTLPGGRSAPPVNTTPPGVPASPREDPPDEETPPGDGGEDG